MPSQLAIIAAVTVLFLISASTGLYKGIQLLSNTNMLLVLAFIIGPTIFLLDPLRPAWAGMCKTSSTSARA